jgi:hypothetical protein
MDVKLPVTYRASRVHWAPHFAIGGGFVAMGMLAFQGKFLGAASSAAVFAAFVGLLLIYRRMSATHLKLTEEGFEYVAMFQRKFVAWKDVSEFVPMEVGIGWKHAPAATGVSRIQRVTACRWRSESAGSMCLLRLASPASSASPHR